MRMSLRGRVPLPLRGPASNAGRSLQQPAQGGGSKEPPPFSSVSQAEQTAVHAAQAGLATSIISVTVQPKPPRSITNRRSSMTTAKPTAATTRPPDGFQFEDPPERQPDDMSSFNHLTITGSAYLLAEHLGNRDTTPVAGKIGLLGSTGGGAAGHPASSSMLSALWSPMLRPISALSGSDNYGP